MAATDTPESALAVGVQGPRRASPPGPLCLGRLARLRHTRQSTLRADAWAEPLHHRRSLDGLPSRNGSEKCRAGASRTPIRRLPWASAPECPRAQATSGGRAYSGCPPVVRLTRLPRDVVHIEVPAPRSSWVSRERAARRRTRRSASPNVRERHRFRRGTSRDAATQPRRAKSRGLQSLRLTGAAGLEPATPGFGDRCSAS